MGDLGFLAPWLILPEVVTENPTPLSPTGLRAEL